MEVCADDNQNIYDADDGQTLITEGLGDDDLVSDTEMADHWDNQDSVLTVGERGDRFELIRQ